MIPFLALLLATSLSKASAWEEQCRTFKADSVASVKNLEPTYYPAGSFVNVTSPWSTLTTSNLPAFCRLKFDVLTNPETGKTTGAELWLPDGWNTRMLALVVAAAGAVAVRLSSGSENLLLILGM
jgi:feruloyl esterase